VSLAVAQARGHPAPMDNEPVLSRDEAVVLVFSVNDILLEVQEIRTLLEGEGGEEEEPEE
jgi:hypothetical protein